MSTWKGVECWCSQNFFSGCEMFRYGLCRPVRRSLCWCSGNAYSASETIIYGLCRPVRGSICWCLVITFSGSETFRYAQCRPVRRRFADAQELRFQEARSKIWAVPAYKGVVMLFLRNRVSACETFRYQYCRPLTGFICWCSGITFSGCETFRYAQCRPVTPLICWR